MRPATDVAGRDYDADWLRQAPCGQDIKPCIPARSGGTKAIRHGKALYRQRYKGETMFGRLKDLRQVAMRCARCARTFLSAITVAADVLFRLSRQES